MKKINKNLLFGLCGALATVSIIPLISLVGCGEGKKDTPLCLCFTSQQDGSTIGWSYTGTKPVGLDIEYSMDDGGTWSDWTGSDITLNNGKKLFVRNNGNSLSTSTTNYFKFNIDSNSRISASGSTNSMINDAQLSDYCFYGMFKSCTGLTTAPELPATVLTDRCYEEMFNGCTKLENAPKLPATSLADYCYCLMFKKCTSLTTAPELPVTTLAPGCYDQMFSNCSGLTTAPELPATTLADHCYYAMFTDCTALTTAPELPATELADSCYWQMFADCFLLKIKANSGDADKLIFICPGVIPNDAVSGMFAYTGGDFKDTPAANKSYYWYL